MGQGFSSLLEYFYQDFKLNNVLQLSTPQLYQSAYSPLEEWASSYASDEWIEATANSDLGLLGISNTIDPLTAFESASTTSATKRTVISQDVSTPITTTTSAVSSTFVDDNLTFSNLPLDLFDLEGFDFTFCKKPTVASVADSPATLSLLNLQPTPSKTTTSSTVATSPVPSFSDSNSQSPVTLSPSDLLLPSTPTDSSSSDFHSEALQRQLSDTNSYSSVAESVILPPPIRLNVSLPESMMGPISKSPSSSSSSLSPEPSISLSRSSSSRGSTKSSKSTSHKPRFKDIPDPLAPNTPANVVKRARNTLAARRYRAKKVERMEQLEEQLAEMEQERDRWKNEAMQARLEAEKWKGMWVGANCGMAGNGGAHLA